MKNQRYITLVQHDDKMLEIKYEDNNTCESFMFDDRKLLSQVKMMIEKEYNKYLNKRLDKD